MTKIYVNSTSNMCSVFASLSLLHHLKSCYAADATNKLFFFRFGHKRRGKGKLAQANCSLLRSSKNDVNMRLAIPALPQLNMEL